MPNQVSQSFQNNFTAGLKTEFTGLNFPENAATDTDNCIYTLIGDVLRREGIDYEPNFAQSTVDRAGRSVTSFKWDNAGGDGLSQLVVLQVGHILFFFRVNTATLTHPLSQQILASTVDLNAFNTGFSPDPSLLECQYTSGNGYLFVFHPGLHPFYCTYDPVGNAVTSTAIRIVVRDFDGIQLEGNGGHNDSRPVTLNGEKTYNLLNQGWDSVKFNKFNTDLSEFPANSDVWWRYINTSGVFDPLNTNGVVPFRNTPAPNGHFIVEAFNQLKSAVSGGLPVQDIVTSFRPKTGAWFQGRVWFAGGDASATPVGDAPYYTWTEKIYFSQIAVTPDYFGRCHQVNDPTDKFLFDELPSDGGVINIQGCGSVYKLFPVQNGLLVFASNGIWFITGSQGIGFTAIDFTVTKISSVQSISGTSFVSVLGYPMFWNEEGIYSVTPNPQGGNLIVENICIGTILSYYANIPLQSKKFVRGDYNPIDFTVQWVFRSINETNLTTRYEYDKTLNFNTANKAFYPYSLSSSSTPKINGIIYVVGPGGSGTSEPVFKYLASNPGGGAYRFAFAEEHDSTHFVDWFQFDNVGKNYLSYFIAGYRLAGKALTKWQPTYVYMFLRNAVNNSYKIQGLWEFAISGNSGKWSTVQVINDATLPANFGMKYRRHKIRGHGLAMQLKVQSVDGKPFDIMGWTVFEGVNTNP